MSSLSDLLACSVCLVTDVKLFDMGANYLQDPYEHLTGFKVSQNESRYICSYCGLMLRKFEAFRRRCTETHQYLMNLEQGGFEVSTEYLKTKDETKWSPYECSGTITYTYPLNIKEETTIDFEYDDGIDNTSDSDSEEEFFKSNLKIKREVKSEALEVLRNASFDIESSEAFEGSMEVVMLSKQQQIQEILGRQQSFNYRSALHKCDKCYKGFLTEATFTNHMVRHDPLISGSVICDICQICWPTKRALNTHHFKIHERRYLCRLCNKICKTSTAAKEHSKFHLGFSYACKLCNASFNVRTSYFTHLRLQHPSQHCCDLCGESFVSDKGLKMHKSMTHKSVEKLRTSIHACSQCDVEFDSSEALDKHTHITDHDVCDSNIRSCVKCGENFPTESALCEHLKTHQNTDRFKCEACNKSFVSEMAFALHYQRIHLGVKKTYRPEGKRRETEWVCELCGKKCCSKGSLVCHQRTHSGERPYHCSQCPKTFSVLQRLQIHMRIHTGESPFQCAVCPKAFKHKAALNRHDRVHSGVRPYQCPHCAKCFSQSNSQKMHIRTVHLKMPSPYKHKRTNKNTAVPE